MQIAVVVLATLGGIQRLAFFIVFVLGMPKHQVRNLKLLRQLAGFFNGAVVFFLRGKALSLLIQAKRLG